MLLFIMKSVYTGAVFAVCENQASVDNLMYVHNIDPIDIVVNTLEPFNCKNPDHKYSPGQKHTAEDMKAFLKIMKPTNSVL